jgi:ABC-type branched-subunit amino acid transport system permease subunit
VIYGAIVVLCVLFFPGGVVGLAHRVRSWRRARVSEDAS